MFAISSNLFQEVNFQLRKQSQAEQSQEMIECSTLAQTIVSPKLADQKLLRIDTD